MKLINWLGAGGLLLTLCSAAPVQAEDTLKLVGDSWCPFACDSAETLGLNGFLVDITEIIFAKHNMKVSFKLAPYARAIELVKQNQADAVVGTVKADAPDLVYPEVNQAVTFNVFFVKAGNVWQYKNSASLDALHKIGAVVGYDYLELNDYFTKNTQKVEFMGGDKTTKRNIQKLLMGRLDALIDDPFIVDFELMGMNKQKELVNAGQYGNILPVYVAFSPKNIKAAEYAKWMSDGMKTLRESGELAKLLESYGVKDWQK